MSKRIVGIMLPVLWFLFGGLSPFSRASTITTAASGNWDTGATWGGVAPGAGDSAVIATNHTVTI